MVGQTAVILAPLISGPGALWSLEGGWWPRLQAAWSLAVIESWRGQARLAGLEASWPGHGGVIGRAAGFLVLCCLEGARA